MISPDNVWGVHMLRVYPLIIAVGKSFPFDEVL